MNRQTQAMAGTAIAAFAIISAILMLIAPTCQAIWFINDKRVDHGAGNAYNPVIAVNSTGALVVLWENVTGGDRNISAATSTDNGVTWSGDYRVDAAASGNQYWPDVAISPNNRVHAAWEDARSGTIKVYYASSTDGGKTWGTNYAVNTSSANQMRPAIAVNSTTVFVTWADNRNGNYDIFFAKSTNNGASWSAAKRVDTAGGSSDARYPDIAVDSNNKVVIIWDDARNGNFDIFSSISSDGGSTWSANGRVDDTAAGSANQYTPTLTVDSNNRYHAMWSDLRSTRSQIYYANTTNPASDWNKNIRVDDTASGSAQLPTIAVDKNGMVHGVWEDDRTTEYHIYYSNSTAEWKFATNKRVDTGAGGKLHPWIATDGKVGMFMVWDSDQLTTTNVFFTKNGNMQPDPPTYTNPPNNGWLTVSAPKFNWTFTDPDLGDTQTAYQLQVYNISGTVYDSGIVVSTANGLVYPGNLPDGSYNWKVRVRDSNSTWGVYNTSWVFKIDTVAPTVGTPTDAGTWSASSSLTWTWVAGSDSGSGIGGYNVCVDSVSGGCGLVNNAWTTSASYTYNGGADGTTYYAKVEPKDVAGNLGSFGGNSDGITVDLTAPSAVAAQDEGKWTNSRTVKFTWPAATDTTSGVDGYYICVGTTPGSCNIISNDWTTSKQYSILNGSDGTTYYAKVRAKDNATNLGSFGGNSDGITVDLVAPGAARPIDEGYFAPSSDIKFAWAPSSDDTSGVKGYLVYVGTMPDGKDAVDGAFVTWSNYTFHNALNGKTYYAYVKAQDNATNVGLPSASSDGITVDLTVPTAPVVNDDGLTSKDNEARCWWDAVEDQESGVVKYQVQLVQGATVVKSANTTLTAYKFSNATPFLQNGKMYVFKVRALNGAGNWSAWGLSNGLWVDMQVNATKAATHTGRYSNSSSILWSWPAVIDTPAGIEGYYVDIGTTAGGFDLVSGAWAPTNSYLFTGGTNGQTYYITVKAKDRAGNVAAPTTNSTGVTVDMEPPETGPARDVGAYSPSTNITFSWDAFRDSISGIRGYNIAIGTQPGLDDVMIAFTNKTSYVFKGAVAGRTYYAKVRAIDNAGNIGWWGQPTDGIQVDTTPPSEVTLVTPPGFACTVNYLYLEWSAAQDNLSGIQYYMYALGTTSGATDLAQWTRADGTTAKASGLALQNGKTYYISIKAVNGAGMDGKVHTAPVTIDTVPPSASPITGYRPYTGNTTIIWTWAASTDDRSGIDGYLLSLGTGPGMSDLVNRTFVKGESFSYGLGANGRSYYATIIPVDRAGNLGTPTLGLSVTVDLVPPRMIHVDRAGAYSHGKNVTWTWEGSDSLAGIEGYWVIVSEGDFTNGTAVFVKADRYSQTKDLLEGHTYYIQVKPVDRAGNAGEYAYGDGITIDSVAPTAIVLLNNNATFVNTRDVTLQLVTTHKDVAYMLVSNNQALTGAVWEPFAASRVWYLTPGDGLKEVYVVIRDASGLTSPVYKVQTTLKTTPPKLEVGLPDVVSSSDLTVSGKTDPRSEVLVNDKQVKVEDDGSFSTTVHLKDGTNLVRVTARDQAGNEVSVDRAVNKEPLSVPSWLLTLLVLVLLIISIIALAYAYSANKRLAAIKAAPVKEEPKPRPKAPPKVQERPRRPPPVEEEPEEDEPVVEEPEEVEVEEEPEDDDLTLEEDGAVKRPDILARIKATEDTEAQQIMAAEAEESDEVTLEMTEGPEKKVEEPEPAKPIAQVRCNQCSNLIPIYSTERPLRIECPKCGKVGMIRK